MEERLKKLQDKLQQINSTGAIHKYRDLLFRMEMTRQMMELAQTRQMELKLENTRNLALIALTKAALKKHDQENAGGESEDDD